MAFKDYAPTTGELLFAHDQTALGVMASIDPTDAIIIRPGTALALALPEFTESDERNPSRGVRELIQGKDRVADFTIPLRMRFGAAKGAPVSHALLLERGLGKMEILLTVLAFGSGAGDTITVVIGGVSTVLTEGVDFDAITSNDVTAGEIAAAITALTGVSAAAVGPVVSVQREAGAGRIRLISSDHAFAIPKVKYSLVSDIEERVITLMHATGKAGVGNLVRVFRDAFVNSLTTTLVGTEPASLEVSGFLGNMVMAGVSALGAERSNSPGTGSVTLQLVAGGAQAYLVGPLATDTVFVVVNQGTALEEIFKVTAVDTATDILTADRAQKSTTAQTHPNGSPVGPWIPSADTEPADVQATVRAGSVTIGGTAFRVQSLTQVINNNEETRGDEYGEPAHTGIRPAGRRQVTGELALYVRKPHIQFISDVKRVVEQTAVAVAQAPNAPPGRRTITMGKFRFNTADLDSGGNEFGLKFPYQALESSTGDDETSWEDD